MVSCNKEMIVEMVEQHVDRFSEVLLSKVKEG